MRTNINKIWKDDQIDIENKKMLAANERQTCYNNISKLIITHDMIATIIKRMSKSYECSKYEEYKYLGMSMLKVLFCVNKIDFVNCFRIKKNNNSYIIENSNSNDIIIYGKNFEKKY